MFVQESHKGGYMKLCKDCKHCEKPREFDYVSKYHCLRKYEIRVCLVTGNRIITDNSMILTCALERHNGECGEQGQYWEETK
jgi:hypothetical protein